MKVLDNLHANLKQGPALDLAEDDYDGRVRASKVDDIVMPEGIARIMWNLFDYAAISSRQQAQPSAAVSTVDDNAIFALASGATDVAPSTAGNDDITWDDMPDFDNLWAMENEWLLFGKPWTAYFPSPSEVQSQE